MNVDGAENQLQERQIPMSLQEPAHDAQPDVDMNERPKSPADVDNETMYQRHRKRTNNKPAVPPDSPSKNTRA